MGRPLPPYRCILLDRGGVPSLVVHLMVENDTDAILAGSVLAHEHRHCRGFEVREGERLVFLQMGDEERPVDRRISPAASGDPAAPGRSPHAAIQHHGHR